MCIERAQDEVELKRPGNKRELAWFTVTGCAALFTDSQEADSDQDPAQQARDHTMRFRTGCWTGGLGRLGSCSHMNVCKHPTGHSPTEKWCDGLGSDVQQIEFARMLGSMSGTTSQKSTSFPQSIVRSALNRKPIFKTVARWSAARGHARQLLTNINRYPPVRPRLGVHLHRSHP